MNESLKSECTATRDQVVNEAKRLELLTEQLYKLFNNFATCFTEFQDRAQALSIAHDQLLVKSRDIEKKMKIEVIAQSD